MRSACRRMHQSIGKIVKTPTEWATQLSKQEFEILRNKDTEPAGSGEYDNFYPPDGYFKCKGCEFPLYSAGAKFKAGCGWPAYNACYHSDVGCHVVTKVDTSGGRSRIEILCGRCDGHLGHVFYDEQGPGKERHCVNSVSVKFVKDAPEIAVSDAPVIVAK